MIPGREGLNGDQPALLQGLHQPAVEGECVAAASSAAAKSGREQGLGEGRRRVSRARRVRQTVAGNEGPLAASGGKGFAHRVEAVLALPLVRSQMRPPARRWRARRIRGAAGAATFGRALIEGIERGRHRAIGCARGPCTSRPGALSAR